LIKLEASLPADNENRHLAATIRRNVQLEARLIDDLLDVTRLGQGKIELRKRAVDAHQCVQDAISLCRPAIGARNIAVQTTLEAGNSWVNADSTRIQQIIWNLLQNAVKFSPPQSTISVASENVDGKRLSIRIADAGVGIDAGFLERIFEPFMQAEDAVVRRYGGLGLGLSISKALAEMHEGTLTATSDGRDRGATFSLTLSTIERPAESQPGEPHLDKSSKSGASLRILLVDDHTDTREGLERLLRRKGHQVQTAADMEGAVTVGFSNEFDLLISDIGLPDGSGHELLGRLRQRHPVTAIAISGFGMESDIDASKASGFSEHLVKPIDFAHLHEVILRVTQAGNAHSRDLLR
jgi:CheY-like chemotaxis protein